MGLFDFLKKAQNGAVSPQTAKSPKSEPKEKPGVYNRRVKIVGSRFDNEDGTSRQKILSDIYHKKPPFEKVLNIEFEEYTYEGIPAYHVTVNSFCVGCVNAEMAKFISANKDRILGINDFRVDWESPLEEDLESEFDGDADVDYAKLRERKIKEKDRTYFAKAKISVKSKT